MMSKTLKNILIGAVSAIVLLAVLYLVLYRETPNEGTIKEPLGIVLSTDSEGVMNAVVETTPSGEPVGGAAVSIIKDYSPSVIEKIEITNEHTDDNPITNEHTDDNPMTILAETPVVNGETQATKYTLVGYEDFPISLGIPDAIANDASKLNVNGLISIDGKNAVDFGLEPPKAICRVTYTDGNTAIIKVGTKAPQGYDTYVQFGNVSTIYTVLSEDVDSFFFDPGSLISKEITDPAPSMENAIFKSITLTGSNYKKEITIVNNENLNNTAQYKLTAPFEAYVGPDEINRIAGAVRGLTAESVYAAAPTEDQITKTGLDNPYAIIKAEYPDKTITIRASAPINGRTYLMVDGKNIIFRMKIAELRWVVSTLENIFKGDLFTPKFASISAMTIRTNNKTYKFSIQNVDDSNKVFYNSKELTYENFAVFFQNLTSQHLHEIPESQEKKGSLDFSVTYEYTDGSPKDVVEFYKVTSSDSTVVINGKVLTYAYPMFTTKMKDDILSLVANKSVESY